MRQRARGLRSLSSVSPGCRPATSPDVATLRASDPQPAAAIRRAGSNWRNLGSQLALERLIAHSKTCCEGRQGAVERHSRLARLDPETGVYSRLQAGDFLFRLICEG